MNQINTILKTINVNGNLIISPYTLDLSLVKKAITLTSQELLKKLLLSSTDILFDDKRGGFSDPVLSLALSQYSLNSAQKFIGSNYENTEISQFIENFGLPEICILSLDIQVYVSRFLEMFADAKIYVLDLERFCPEFKSFLYFLEKQSPLNYIDLTSTKAINKKSDLRIATILAPVFTCDVIELKCLNDSIRLFRCSSQQLSRSSVYLTLTLFCDFYLTPSIHTAIPMLKVLLSDDLVRKKNLFSIITNNVFEMFTKNKLSEDFYLPEELTFLKDISHIGFNKFDAVINYLIYLSPLFDGLPIKRKRMLEDYLLGKIDFDLPIDLEQYDGVELISDINSEWCFKHSVYVSTRLPINSYPVIANKQTSIELMES